MAGFELDQRLAAAHPKRPAFRPQEADPAILRDSAPGVVDHGLAILVLANRFAATVPDLVHAFGIKQNVQQIWMI